MNVRTETWAGHKIRFVWHDGEWWAVARDVCDSLGIKLVTRALSGLPEKGVHIMKTPTNGGMQEVNIINEQNIYRLIFKSRKPEAEQFQDWVYNMLKQLRQATGLEGFQIFQMLDKEHLYCFWLQITHLPSTNREEQIKEDKTWKSDASHQ